MSTYKYVEYFPLNVTVRSDLKLEIYATQLLKMKLNAKSFVIIAIVATFRTTEGFPNGAPVSSCASMTPGHLKDKLQFLLNQTRLFPIPYHLLR